MNKIVHKVYITKNPRTPPIEVVYASSVPIRLELMDYTIPSGASAKVNANPIGSEDVYQASCTVDGNAVEFTPTPGFFAVGKNDLQLEINDSIIGHALDVVCETRLKDKAGGDIAADPETVASFTARAEAAAASAAGYAEAANRAAAGASGNGTDLTARFSGEIGATNVWTWLRQRIAAGAMADIYAGDYIPVACKNSVTINAQVAGINTYKGYGNPEIGNHIDFISKNLWPVAHAMNPVRWNNGFVSGDAGSEHPFLASDMYYWLNSLSGTVPGDTAAPPDTAATAVDYTADGIWIYLPDELQAVITDKILYLPKRYSDSGVLTADNSAAMVSCGKLWIPMEVEVFGTAMFGNSGYGVSGGAQYPIFASRGNAVKRYGDNNWRSGWWLCSAAAGKSTSFVSVSSQGVAAFSSADSTGTRVPVCFRIEG